jgi:hypothetical protein
MKLTRTRLAAFAAVLALAAPAATALSKPPTHPVTIKPASHPKQLDPHSTAPGGDPAPERLGTVHPAKRCLPGVEQPGTVALQRYIDHWFIGHSDGINNCRNIHDTDSLSTHSEGRAFDWHLDVNVANERKAAHRIIHFFLRKDSKGVKYAMARRFGVELIIYNDHIWSVTFPGKGMRPCGDDCSDHFDHLHIEQNWKGAHRKTSAWKGWTFRVPDVTPKG